MTLVFALAHDCISAVICYLNPLILTAAKSSLAISLKSNRQKARIAYDEILYIESLSDYIKVHTVEKGEITSKEKISVIVEKLPTNFIRIYRSFVINTNKLTQYSSTEVELNGIHLNIGRSYKKQVMPVLQTI